MPVDIYTEEERADRSDAIRRALKQQFMRYNFQQNAAWHWQNNKPPMKDVEGEVIRDEDKS